MNINKLHIKKHTTGEMFKDELINTLCKELQQVESTPTLDLIDMFVYSKKYTDIIDDNHLLQVPVVHDILKHNNLTGYLGVNLGVFEIQKGQYCYGVLADVESEHSPYGYFIMYIDTNNKIKVYMPRYGNSINGDTLTSFFNDNYDTDKMNEINDNYAISLGYSGFTEYQERNPLNISMVSILSEIKQKIKG